MNTGKNSRPMFYLLILWETFNCPSSVYIQNWFPLESKSVANLSEAKAFAGGWTRWQEKAEIYYFTEIALYQLVTYLRSSTMPSISGSGHNNFFFKKTCKMWYGLPIILQAGPLWTFWNSGISGLSMSLRVLTCSDASSHPCSPGQNSSLCRWRALRNWCSKEIPVVFQIQAPRTLLCLH